MICITSRDGARPLLSTVEWHSIPCVNDVYVPRHRCEIRRPVYVKPTSERAKRVARVRVRACERTSGTSIPIPRGATLRGDRQQSVLAHLRVPCSGPVHDADKGSAVERLVLVRACATDHIARCAHPHAPRIGDQGLEPGGGDFLRPELARRHRSRVWVVSPGAVECTEFVRETF